MKKFKEGDKVRCIDNSGTYISSMLTKGKVYEVQDYNGSLADEVRIRCDDTGTDRHFYEKRFELVSTAALALAPSAQRKTTLPIDSNERKNVPMFRGCLRYFPAALAGVANTSKLGNDKHNPNEEMHHARGKSTDQGDCILRHLMDVEDLLAAQKRGDSSVTSEAILIEVNQLAWRALAFSQEIHEKLGAPLAPGAK